MDMQASVISRSELPQLFPTHRHEAEFWEHLGRALATYGFLEEVLGKAIFVFTGTQPYEPHEIDEAYRKWIPDLEKALSDTLAPLADAYGRAVNANKAATITNVQDLVAEIKEATKLRNALCHGSWQLPNADGAAKLLYVTRQMERFDSEIDVCFLQKTQRHVVDLACSVIDTVTSMGWQFPGGAGLGKPVWP